MHIIINNEIIYGPYNASSPAQQLITCNYSATFPASTSDG